MDNIGNILDEISRFQNNESQRTSGNQTYNNTYTSSANSSGMPDMETMMRIMNIMNAMNLPENNASANLLNSLRPFLRESKQDKVDQYIKFIKK